MQVRTRLGVAEAVSRGNVWEGDVVNFVSVRGAVQRLGGDGSGIRVDENSVVVGGSEGESVGARAVADEVEAFSDSVGDSDAGIGSEMEEYEWDEGDEELESVEDLEALDSDLEDTEETSEPREPRKSNGREPNYSMRIEAPIDEVYALLHSRGFITAKQTRPTPNDSVLGQEDHHIVSWYRRVSVGLLNYYSCCDNFLKVKAIVNYQLRWSAIHTLSKKHKSSSRQVIQKYGKNLVVTRDGKTLASFLSVEEIKKHSKGFLEIDPVPPETLIDVLYTRMKRRSREEKEHS